jgi:hypothetical protein
MKEAMKLALEALELMYGCYANPSWVSYKVHEAQILEQTLDTITAIKEALAKQEQGEPVAWYEYNQDLDAWFLAYTNNPKAKSRPLVFGDTTPPQLKPLTDEQIEQMWERTGDYDSFARAIEAAHGIGDNT